MIDKPLIVLTLSRATAIIRLNIPKADIQKEMGLGHSELFAAIAAQGIAPAAPWFTHHLRIDPEVWDFEIGVPVAKPITLAGRVGPSKFPAIRVARTVYTGPYEGLGDAWGEFDTWVKGEGLTPAADLWEVYLAGPETGPDSSQYRTQLNRPLVG